jgi:hypothetical protein
MASWSGRCVSDGGSVKFGVQTDRIHEIVPRTGGGQSRCGAPNRIRGRVHRMVARVCILTPFWKSWCLWTASENQRMKTEVQKGWDLISLSNCKWKSSKPKYQSLLALNHRRENILMRCLASTIDSDQVGAFPFAMVHIRTPWQW